MIKKLLIISLLISVAILSYFIYHLEIKKTEPFIPAKVEKSLGILDNKNLVLKNVVSIPYGRDVVSFAKFRANEKFVLEEFTTKHSLIQTKSSRAFCSQEVDKFNWFNITPSMEKFSKEDLQSDKYFNVWFDRLNRIVLIERVSF